MTPVLGLGQRDTVMCTLAESSADARLGQTPAMQDERFRLLLPLQHWGLTVLMSNISPFDKSRATGHRAEDVTAGEQRGGVTRQEIN